VALEVAGLALGLAAEAASSWSAGDLVAGWTLLGCGLLAWDRRPASREGVLLAAAGAAWFAANWWPAALYLHRGPLIHALLGFPSGRVSGRSRIAVAAAYLDGSIYALGRAPAATLALCVLVAAAALDGWRAESGRSRRARSGATAAALTLCVVLAVESIGRLAGWSADRVLLHTYELALIVIAVGLTIDLLRGGWSERALAGLVVDLGAEDAPLTLRDKLARALGDPSLAVAYSLRDGGGLVDEAGRPFALPSPGSGRAVTPVEHRGKRVAVLVHDPLGADDPALVSAVAAVARVAVVNVRLQAEVRARVSEVAASRRRVVEAAGAERRRLASELRDGAVQRLGAVAVALERFEAETGGAPPPLLAEVRSQLDAAGRELQRLAAGIHPAQLTGGLAPALAELARRAPIRVDVRVAAGRLPADVEGGAYFVCSEALANVLKHARASRVRIDGEVRDRELRLVIADDGVGGADPSAGSGLRGLQERLAALGGRLELDSPAGGGTRVDAAIPLG
jgi:signal transduction histidine kinase